MLKAILKPAFMAAAICLCAPLAAHPQPAAAAVKLAPADEYFGPLAMSVLGIRNVLRDDAARLDVDPSSASEDAMRDAVATEAAIRDWESKYPGDSWLPRAIYSLHGVYQRLRTDDGRRHAIDTAGWLIERYGQSAEADSMRVELAQISVH